MVSKLTMLVVALTLGGTLIGMNRMVDVKDEAWPLEKREYFTTLDNLKSEFKSHVLDCEFHEGRLAQGKYVVVVAFPYSGMNSFEVYCYRDVGVNWALYNVSFIADAHVPMKAEVKEVDDAIEISHNGVVLSRLRFNKFDNN